MEHISGFLTQIGTRIADHTRDGNALSEDRESLQQVRQLTTRDGFERFSSSTQKTGVPWADEGNLFQSCGRSAKKALSPITAQFPLPL